MAGYAYSGKKYDSEYFTKEPDTSTVEIDPSSTRNRAKIHTEEQIVAANLLWDEVNHRDGRCRGKQPCPLPHYTDEKVLS